MSEAMRPEDDLGFAGKVAIVTGGGAPDDGIGNGRAAAMLMARSGAKILVVDILRESAEQTVRMIEGEGGAAVPFVADVADEAGAKSVTDESRSGEFRRVDFTSTTMLGSARRGSVDRY